MEKFDAGANAPQSENHAGALVKEPALGNLIAGTLRGGVLISAVLVLLGYLTILRNGIPMRHFYHFTGQPITGRWGVLDVLISLRDRHSAEDFITLGLLVLILTPVVRVAMSLVVFLYESDRLYAALTAVVLGVLLFSLLVGSV